MTQASNKDAKSKDDTDKTGVKAANGAKKRKGTRVRLVPADNSDRPIVSNYSTINVSPGMVFIDFGFLEPSLLAALPRVAGTDGDLPESVNGRLAARMAIGYEAMANLHQQLGKAIDGINARTPKKDKKE